MRNCTLLMEVGRGWFFLIVLALTATLFQGCSDSGGSGSAAKPEAMAAFESPVRIALADDGTVVVTDFSAARVFSLDPLTLEITDSFSAPNQLAGVAVSGDTIFVGMEATGAVGAYDFSGQLLYKFGVGDGEFIKPNDIVVDEAFGSVYVVDTGAKTVKVYDLDGTLAQAAFGKGLLNYPTGITVDVSSNTILVSDFAVELGGSFRAHVAGIWRFDFDGNFIEKIKGSFSRPQGIAVEGGKIYLADSLLGQILVLEKDPNSSAYLEVIRYGGDDPGETPLRLPLDVVIDPVSKDLFVTNNALGMVTLFAGGGL